jgi:hypothetical protein
LRRAPKIEAFLRSHAFHVLRWVTLIDS